LTWWLAISPIANGNIPKQHGRFSMATGGLLAPPGRIVSFASAPVIAAGEPIRGKRCEIPKREQTFFFRSEIILGEVYDQPDKH
jgi:hypothetical protein